MKLRQTNRSKLSNLLRRAQYSKWIEPLLRYSKNFALGLGRFLVWINKKINIYGRALGKHLHSYSKRSAKKASQNARKVHHHIAKRPHGYFMEKSPKYARWHSWRYKGIHHSHVHFSIAAAWFVFTVFLAGSIIGPVSALSTWQQTDWSGGVGTNAESQYSSLSNINAADQSLTLSSSANAFSNSSLNSNLDGWNGANNSLDTTTKLSGAGSAKITAAASSSNLFNAGSTTSIDTTDAQRLVNADLNNDGLDDIVLAGGSTNKIYIYTADGKGGYETPDSYDTLAQTAFDLATGDFDGDGSTDIAVSYKLSTASFSVFTNNGDGTAFVKTDYTGPAPRPCSIATADFNNDGHIDIAFNCYVSTYFFVYLNNGSGVFTGSTTYNGGNTQLSGFGNLVAFDFNGDGYMDLASVPAQTGCRLRLLINNGGSGFNTYSEYLMSPCAGSGNVPYALEPANVNHDDYTDLIVVFKAGSSAPGGNVPYVSVVLGNADGVVSSNTNYPALAGIANSNTDIAFKDFNQDGWGDIAVNSSSSNLYSVYLNNGDGTYADRTDYTSGTMPVGITDAELNGDGRSDLVYVNRTGQTISTNINKKGGDTFTHILGSADSDIYQLEAYAYTTGSAVTSSDVALWANGSSISTTYQATGTPGWYKLTGKIDGLEKNKGYGVLAKPGKTVYVDDFNLYKYASSGTLTSAVFDLGYGGDWGAVSYESSGAGVDVKVRTSNAADMSGASDFAGCPSLASDTDLTGQTCITNNHRYVQYQVGLTAQDGDTPQLTSFSLAYDPWDTDPPSVNASAISMKKAAGGTTIAENEWSNGSSPYFEWSAANDGSGSGIKGYCLYLGHDDTADPSITKGILGTSPLDTEGACPFAVSSLNLNTDGLLGTALATSDTPYYLSISAIDNAGNIYADTPEQFAFRFDNTPPQSPAYLTAPSQFVADKEVTITWPSSGGNAPTDANSGLYALQYKIGTGGTWHGDEEGGGGYLNNDGTYTTREDPDYDELSEGNNLFYIRSVDNAGNVSSVAASTVIKINNSSPSSPLNVTATPSTNTTNSFAFSWDAPSSYTGSASSLKYCYTVNTLPTVNTCTFTEAGETSLPAGAFATQPGANTFYVVSKDEAGNINYDTAANVTFSANTSAPGVPLDTDIADVSVKASSQWKLAVTWSRPSDVGAGISSYKIYRSENGSSYSPVASTSGTSYVDSGLDQTRYYYKIRACDSANNCGAFSSAVNKLPTGRFTTPANITALPKVTNVSTRKASVSWATDRSSDSKISLGTSSGKYVPFQIASDTQTTDHNVQLDNLTPGTTYFAKAAWTDEDGNTGYSSEFSFKTQPAPSTEEVVAKNITLSSARINFTASNAVKILIQYGKSNSFGGVKEVATSFSRSSYDVELDGLDDGTKYFYRLNTFDADGNQYESNTTFSFTTPPRPRIENLRFEPISSEPTSTQKITWTTNVPSSSLVRFSAQNRPAKEVSESNLTTDHKLIIRNLEDNTNYNFVAESRDKDGNLAVSDQQNLKTAEDTRPPEISDIVIEPSIRGVGAEARGQIAVSWKTDEPATSQVGYAEGSAAKVFNSKTAEDQALSTEHVVIVSDLPTSRVYSVQPISKDRAGNATSGNADSAIIGRASDSVITIVLNVLRKVFGF